MEENGIAFEDCGFLLTNRLSSPPKYEDLVFVLQLLVERECWCMKLLLEVEALWKETNSHPGLVHL